MNLHQFGANDPLAALANEQAQYLRCYLSDLGAKAVVEEPEYFDRDYLDEYSAYYSRVATPTSNRCRRLHFFSRPITKETLKAALEGAATARRSLQTGYLGFVVVRPLKHAPLGRSVIKWYPDNLKRYEGNPRITPASRDYVVHLAGISLRVKGLAWQQQDGAVALCATTALWSMLHSSAFDDHHAVPTTAEVTRLAYHSARQGLHVFPATDGLDVRQMTDAIARAKLTPMVMVGDVLDTGTSVQAFSREKFAACAVMLRSGFPVLISGRFADGGGHVICATGFRDVGARGSPGDVVLQDAEIETFYAHDDNLGPNVRLSVGAGDYQEVTLQPSPPPKRYKGKRLPDPAEGYPVFTPGELIVGVHEGLHITPDELHQIAMRIMVNLKLQIEQPTQPLTATARFVRIAEYLQTTLATPFGGSEVRSPALGLLRQRISEKLPALSLYVGVVRIGFGNAPVADILIDTSDRPRLARSDWNAFGTILFAPEFEPAITALQENLPLGVALVRGQ
jgi:hypothetical protein